VAPNKVPRLEVLIKGIFEKNRFLDLLQNFIRFEVDGPTITKKVAGYHQFHAVNKAIDCRLRASAVKGDRRVGVVWHTQGSGKSLSMVFYTRKIATHPKMKNPTVVVITDRNDLDGQLFDNCTACQGLLRQEPQQAEDRADLQDRLRVASGGIIFTTIQKFFPDDGKRYPKLSDRRNVVVIADEAHRSQYDFIDGFARHIRDALPHASFLGFTGTPIERSDRSTPAVFGDYIDIYDIERAVEDGATVPIYYEGRLAKLELDESEKPKIDPNFEEVTEGEEPEKKERLKRKWARLEAMVGTEKRIGMIAKDIVDHFERRLEAMDGKAMIVCMSRRICADMYEAITKLRPQWHGDDDDDGKLKIVITGSASDDEKLQPHIRSKAKREKLRNRFRDPKDHFGIVIVRDMWLAGFDAPCLHTMYVDKPMRGHGLMQAIARVNRVFKDKPGGLVVDYLGLADELKKALAYYTEGDRRKAGIPKDDAVAILLEKYEIIRDMFHGFDYTQFFKGAASKRMRVIPASMEHILAQHDGKERFLKAVNELSKAFALSVPDERALAIRDDVALFQAIRAAFLRTTPGAGKSEEELDAAVKQIVSKAVSSNEIVDIFGAAGLKSPDISILSEEFLEDIRRFPQKNLALEMLKKLLNDQIKDRLRKNVVQARSFAEMLEGTIREYQNRAITTAQVIQQLIEIAKEMREALKRGEKLGLTDDELAFYDALAANESAVQVLGDETLRQIAQEIAVLIRRNVAIDWTLRESVRAKLRVMGKRVLREHGYPPDKQEAATVTVLEQAEVICRDWVA